MVNSPVCIRVEGNNRIGTGHVRRCVAIAAGLREAGIAARFVLSSDACADTVAFAGFDYDVANAEIGRDSHEFISLLERHGADLVIVDSYAADEGYLSSVREHVPLFAFCEGGEFNGVVDIACDYSFSASPEWFASRYETHGSRCLVGPEFAPLQPSFWDITTKPIKHGAAENILVTSGGTDPLGICASFAETLLSHPVLSGCQIHIAVGPLFGEQEKLSSLANVSDRVVLHKGEEMRDLLPMSDIVVSSGGTTVYEVMRAGVPAVFYSFVNNHVVGQDALAPYGHVGDIRDRYGRIDLAKLTEIADRVAELSMDELSRSSLSGLFTSKVDGQGARRIAREIKRVIGKQEES